MLSRKCYEGFSLRNELVANWRSTQVGSNRLCTLSNERSTEAAVLAFERTTYKVSMHVVSMNGWIEWGKSAQGRESQPLRRPRIARNFERDHRT